MKNKTLHVYLISGVQHEDSERYVCVLADTMMESSVDFEVYRKWYFQKVSIC